MHGANFKAQVKTRSPNRMPGVLDRPCLHFMYVPVQGLKPRLERCLQESLRRLRFPWQLNSGNRRGVGGISRFVACAGKVELSWSATSPPTTNVFAGLGFLSRGQSLLDIRLIGYEGELLWRVQPQLPFMYNSCFDFPLPPAVSGFAADFESFVIVPLLLCKTRHAVGPRVEVGPCRRPRRRQGPPPQLMKWGLGIWVTPVLRLLVYLSPVGCGQKRAYR